MASPTSPALSEMQVATVKQVAATLGKMQQAQMQNQYSAAALGSGPYGINICPLCGQNYPMGNVHWCPTSAVSGGAAPMPTQPGLVSEDRLREIIRETIALDLKRLVREAIADDRDAQQRHYEMRKLAKERDQEEEARDKG